MSACPRAGRMFGGCRFEPRYDARPAPPGDFFWTIVSVPASAVPRIAAPKYLGDICVRCGEWRARPEKPA